jgi:hypothetical protein
LAKFALAVGSSATVAVLLVLPLLHHTDALYVLLHMHQLLMLLASTPAALFKGTESAREG